MQGRAVRSYRITGGEKGTPIGEQRGQHLCNLRECGVGGVAGKSPHPPNPTVLLTQGETNSLYAPEENH